MSSDISKSLEEINSKLQIILENAFLSKLDLMFSVLMSLTIFAVGFMLNNVSSIAGLLRAFLISILVLMIYTLVGEFWAILKDDAVRRFAYWISLLAALGVSVVFLSFSVILVLPPPLSILYLIFPFTFLVFLSWLSWQIDVAFMRYTRRLPSRKLPTKALKPIWIIVGRGYLFFTASLILNLLLFGV